MAKVKRTTSGANFVSNERFGKRNQVTATAEFNLEYTGRSGRSAREAMLARKAAAAAIKPEPKTAGLVKVDYTLAYKG